MSKKIIAVVGYDTPLEIKNSLLGLGFNLKILPCTTNLDMPIRSHADMLIFNLEKSIFCSKGYYKLAENVFCDLAEYGYQIVKCDTELDADYPHDIPFNVALFKNTLIGNTKYTASEIIEYASSHKFDISSVKQGYAKCSTVILGDIGIITADKGIAQTVLSKGAKILEIENSSEGITLPGYNYGFLGGASGVFENNVYFAGDILLHPQGTKIKLFCEKLGFNTVCLSNKKLFDIGGILFFAPLH